MASPGSQLAPSHTSGGRHRVRVVRGSPRIRRRMSDAAGEAILHLGSGAAAGHERPAGRRRSAAHRANPSDSAARRGQVGRRTTFFSSKPGCEAGLRSLFRRLPAWTCSPAAPLPRKRRIVPSANAGGAPSGHFARPNGGRESSPARLQLAATRRIMSRSQTAASTKVPTVPVDTPPPARVAGPMPHFRKFAFLMGATATMLALLVANQLIGLLQ